VQTLAQEYRDKTNNYSRQITAKAVETNVLIRQAQEMSSAFDEINQESLNRALAYERTAFSYNISVLYFSDEAQLQSLIESSFHSIIASEATEDLTVISFVMSDNPDPNIDKNDLIFEICE